MRRVAIDSNLLVLLAVGRTSRELIQRHKRTNTFLPADYDLLLKLLTPCEEILVTPSVCCEASNLVSQIGEPNATECRRTLGLLIGTQSERYIESAKLVRTNLYARLGITDASLHELASAGIPLLTVDLGLYLAACQVSADAVNFNHIRQHATLEV